MRPTHNTALILLTMALAFAMDRAIAHRVVVHRDAVGAHRSLQSLPLRIGGKTGSPEDLSQEVLSVLRPDEYLLRQYRGGSLPLTLFIAYYGHQHHLLERIHTPSMCLPGAGWLPIDREYQEIPIAHQPPVMANRYVVEKGGHRQVILYWFAGRGRVIANDVQATLYLAYDTLRGRGSDESLVRLNAPVQRSVQATLAEEVRFIQALYPEMQWLFAVP